MSKWTVQLYRSLQACLVVSLLKMCKAVASAKRPAPSAAGAGAPASRRQKTAAVVAAAAELGIFKTFNQALYDT
jgi:hypothetical protein